MIEIKLGNGLFVPASARGAEAALLFDNPEPDDADDDQVDRHDVVQEARHDEDENAGDERNDGLQVADADGHGSLRWCESPDSLPEGVDGRASDSSAFPLPALAGRGWRVPKARARGAARG